MADDIETGEKRVDPLPERQPLPMPIKRRIVELFATFHGVSAVRVAILSEFGRDVPMSTLAHYDPARGKRMSPRLKKLHEEVRAAYVERSADVAIAHQAHRLRLLSTIVEKAEKARDFGNAIKGLELAAREMGGQLTNVQKREVQGTVEHRHLSVEDARQELATRLGGLLERLPPPQPKDAGELTPED